jgi:AAA15 family ATPase/GTPase
MVGAVYLIMKLSKEEVMENKISFIEIENFKTFDKLKIEGFKRVNLISGKNNLGKTALIEALNLNLSSVDFNNLAKTIKDVLKRRGDDIELDFFKQGNSNLFIKTDKRNISLEYIHKLPEIIVNLTINQETQGIDASRLFKFPINLNHSFMENIKFITTGSADINYLAELYGVLVTKGKDNFLDQSLQIFDENIVSVKLILEKNKPKFKIEMKNISNRISLSSLGDGINRFMAIICAIWASQDGYLFIDEVENGIHYTNYSKLWKIIFEVSKEANCQIFATTHSKECIEAFNKQNEDNEAVFIELYKNKKDEIVAKTRDYEQLHYSLTHSGSFRGE